MSKKTVKIGLFVDVQNIYYTTRDAYSKPFNYRAFWQLLSQQGDIVTAKAYAIDRADDAQIKFQDALRHIGFEVKLKPFIQRSDGTAKGDWDVGITIDMMASAPNLDRVVLLSGDGDFAILMHHLKANYPIECWAVGVESLTAHALQGSVDKFIPIKPMHLL